MVNGQFATLVNLLRGSGFRASGYFNAKYAKPFPYIQE